ncbi:winged helix-turn-helix domain-containing protein [Aurantimonas sp. A2-1-M11]|uniref:winged helix-turn-helix domain-containing protein n=1 Tax=Aurantimonas sp. A2-1-M11 TaxID=3113712 RepID=UPI003FA5422D
MAGWERGGGFSRQKARPTHPQSDPARQARFKNVWLAPPASDFLTAFQSAPTYPVSGP